jgi:hypothetical protein
MRTLRDVVVPVVCAYALLVGVVVHSVHHPELDQFRSLPGGWRPRLRVIVLTVGGGYVCFLAIVVVFHVWVVGERGAMRSALRGGTFLAIVCAASFILGSILEARLRPWGRNRRRTPGD